MHQALRFFPDEAFGYAYPDMYKKYFGEDYSPEPYIHEEYKRARDSKYYETSRLICVNDIYAFDPNAKVGPAGIEQAKFISDNAAFPYTIDFENSSNATAPAQIPCTAARHARMSPWRL